MIVSANIGTGKRGLLLSIHESLTRYTILRGIGNV